MPNENWHYSLLSQSDASAFILLDFRCAPLLVVDSSLSNHRSLFLSFLSFYHFSLIYICYAVVFGALLVFVEALI